MLNTVDMANDYFSTNFLGNEAWSKIDTKTKEMLLETAENDIVAYLQAPAVDSSVIYTEKPYSPFQMAVFEWGLYLYTNKARIEQNIRQSTLGISTISVDGIGQETKGQASVDGLDAYNDMIARSPAMRYLRMIYRDVRIIR